jgi:hypothetical protein
VASHYSQTSQLVLSLRYQQSLLLRYPKDPHREVLLEVLQVHQGMDHLRRNHLLKQDPVLNLKSHLDLMTQETLLMTHQAIRVHPQREMMLVQTVGKLTQPNLKRS